MSSNAEKLVATKNLSHDEWLEYRKKGIGGSEAGSICGLNPYVSPMSVYMDKISDTVDNYDNESMRQGRDFEEYVAKRFTEETGKKVKRSNFIYSNHDYPFMIANIDRLVVGENAGLECKTVSPYSASFWDDEQIPAHYYYQCLHYMAVTGADHWYIAALIFGKKFIWRRIDRKEALIANLISTEKDFWYDHIMKKIPPEPDGTEATENYIKNTYYNSVSKKTISLFGVDDEILQHNQLANEIKKLEKAKKTIEEKIKMRMDDAEIAVTENFLVSWPTIISERIDTERLKSEQPELYKEYCKESCSRRFSIKSAA